MKVILAQHYGLCFGVRDALVLASKLAAEGPLTVLGEIVHNPVARERLERAGVTEGRLDDLRSVGEPNSRVLITAHGAADERRQAWTAAGHQLHDATCPLVHRAHRQLRALVAAGFHPVVIGQPGHVEVRGLTGDFSHASIIDSSADIADLPDAPRFGVIAQTTRPADNTLALVAALRAARPNAEVRFCDTVCQPTKDRQNALRALLAQVDSVVVVGGFASNNTRQLVRAVEAAGRRAWPVERSGCVRAEWFRRGENVGLTAGTSTLPETVAAVHNELEAIARGLRNEPVARPRVPTKFTHRLRC